MYLMENISLLAELDGLLQQLAIDIPLLAELESFTTTVRFC